ncbi:MAG: hypothetical protein ACR2RE_13985, partial [Geminicoccaceae bacterium]
TFEHLESSIKAAHAADRLDRLATVYAESAKLYERQGEIDAACFFWTQAYVIALDAGIDSLADGMEAKLTAFGRMG